ncbi:hypothetical protein K474DRAFT_1664698 [Panus rudis PR-1116 ss-1]|nr:hypothetical protein K474DRAFT_1664698 [Panus rudis PR-1116 ss-1]
MLTGSSCVNHAVYTWWFQYAKAQPLLQSRVERVLVECLGLASNCLRADYHDSNEMLGCIFVYAYSRDNVQTDTCSVDNRVQDI